MRRDRAQARPRASIGESMNIQIKFNRLAILLIFVSVSGAAAASGITPISDAGRRGQAPDVAIGGDGTIHVIWLDKGVVGTADRRGSYSGGRHSHQSFTDLYYARSDDAGESFSRPVRINAEDGAVWGFSISKPEVAAGPDGVVHVYYPANAVSPTTGKDVASSAYVRSVDGGKSFGKPLFLNSDPEEDLSHIVSGGLAQAQVFGAMATSPAGDVYTFWLDTREMNADDMLTSVYARFSHDNGKSFGPERRLYLTDACPCCQVTAAVGDDDEVFLASRVVSGDHVRTPMVSVSRDRGETFSERVAVSGPAWRIEGCPLKPTALAIDGANVYTLVHNGAAEPPGLLFARSADAGVSFGEAIPIHPDAGVSNHPVLVATDDALVAVWHAKVDAGRRVYLRRSTDSGVTFGPVAELEAPEGTSAFPDAAAMPDGALLVVWQQGEQILSQRLTL